MHVQRPVNIMIQSNVKKIKFYGSRIRWGSAIPFLVSIWCMGTQNSITLTHQNYVMTSLAYCINPLMTERYIFYHFSLRNHFFLNLMAEISSLSTDFKHSLSIPQSGEHKGTITTNWQWWNLTMTILSALQPIKPLLSDESMYNL